MNLSKCKLCIVVFTVMFSGVGRAQTLAAAPVVPKEFESSMNKDDRNNLKHCSDDNPKHAGAVAGACVGLGRYLVSAKKDDLAEAAFQRSCALNNSDGCNELGHLRYRTGHLDTARTAWGSPPCTNALSCQLSLFFAVSDQRPVDLAEAEKLGMPLCDDGHQDKVCDRLKQIGSSKDFASIAKKHRDEHIAYLNKSISQEQNNIVVSQGLLALAQSGQSTASGMFQTLYWKGQVAMYNSSIRGSQNNIAKMQSELASLDATPTSTGPGLGSMLANAGMQITAAANTMQNGGTPTFTAPGSTDNQGGVMPVSAAATALGSTGSILYNGPNAEWVRRILATAGSYTCTPNGAPKVQTTSGLSCQMDNSFAQAQLLAWGAECADETGSHDEAVKIAQNLVIQLDTIKTLSQNAVRYSANGGSIGKCRVEQVLTISELP